MALEKANEDMRSRVELIWSNPYHFWLGFPIQILMYLIVYDESWVPKNLCFRTLVLEETLESPLNCKEIQPVNPKENQSWIFIGKIDAEAEAPILWPPIAKNWLTGKDPVAGKDWRQKEKGTTEDQIVGWHHWLDREAWHAAVHGVTQSWTRLSDWTELNLLICKVRLLYKVVLWNKWDIIST